MRRIGCSRMASVNPLKLINARIDVVRAGVRVLDLDALRERLAPLRGLSYRNHPAVLDLSALEPDAIAQHEDPAFWRDLLACFEDVGLRVVALAAPEAFTDAAALAARLSLAIVDADSMALRREPATPAASPAPGAALAMAAASDAEPAASPEAEHAAAAGTDPQAPHPDVAATAAAPQVEAASLHPEPAPPEPEWLPPLVIERHVRSGQQIYGRRRDVVIIASVSPGAEVIADGHITCYGELRGRAIAGAAGKSDARILALDFRPELVAVAGIYKTFEAGPPSFPVGRIVQVRQDRDGEGLSITAV